MVGGESDAETGSAFWHGWRADGLDEEALFKKVSGGLDGEGVMGE
jgi:hypothetical protein